MTKTELIDAISDKTGIAKKDINEMLRAFEQTIVDSIAKGDTIILPGFLKFYRRVQPARSGKIPGSNKTYKVPQKNVPCVTAGKLFKDTVAAGK